MNLSCLFHRWVARRKSVGEEGGATSFSRHAETCQRCAVYSQRMRALDSKFRSVRGAGEEEFPGGLHAKIIASVRDARFETAHAKTAAASVSEVGNRRGVILFSLCGAAAALVLTLFALANREAGITPDPAPILAASAGESASAVDAGTTEPEPKEALVPSATRRVTEFTGELPSFLVSKVSKPYESEMELLADDLNAATDFLSAVIFVSDVPEPDGL